MAFKEGYNLQRILKMHFKKTENINSNSEDELDNNLSV